jgi:hypothetical protein
MHVYSICQYIYAQISLIMDSQQMYKIISHMHYGDVILFGHGRTYYCVAQSFS